MGRRTAEALLDRRSFEIVGAVDIAEDLVGRDLGRILEKPRDLGVEIRSDAEGLFSEVEADAVVLTTTSHLTGIKEQIQTCISHGLNVVSTCEELFFPSKRHPGLAAEIDGLARQGGVTVVGTGINPGFLMDLLPAVLTGPCLKVDSVTVNRMMDSSRRREPFQKKVGTGLTEDEFRKQIENGVITGHVGLLESINFIAGALKWELDEAVELPPEAVAAEKETPTAFGLVPPGRVVGLVSEAYGAVGGREVIRLAFTANAAVTEEYDEIIIEGLPRIHQKIIGGVHGDVGTVAMTINTIARAVEAPAGLATMIDLPPVVAVP
jgi:4-hydroxy-tetrahydrodipicolinate reductase